HGGDRLRERSFRAVAALEDVGLVEMDVGLDQARGHQPAVELFLRRVGDDGGRDLDDGAGGTADVDKALLTIGQPALTQDEVERHPLASGSRRAFDTSELDV